MVINRSEIAVKTGLSRASISAIFNGKRKNPSFQTLKKIADALECSIDELLEQIKKDTEHPAKNDSVSKTNNDT